MASAGSAVRSFLEKTLEIPVVTVNSLNIEQVDKIEQGRRSLIQNEVRVVFASSRERDIVQSYASNLAKVQGKAGIRMELPEHLRGLFKTFEAHSASLRRRFPGLKRAIKYNDQTQSLCMDVRMPDKMRWHKIGEAEMWEILRRYSNMQRVAGGEKAGDEEDRKKIMSIEGDDLQIPAVPEDNEGSQ